MGKKVQFTAMEHASRADYDLVFEHDAENISGQAARVVDWLKMMDGDSPYQISRLDHCLQTATRAERDGADEETIVCALLHDIGDVIAPANHSQAAAALLRPYISAKNYWIVLNHGLFQGYYWMHHYDQDKNARDQYKDHTYYQDCVDFCANWDQPSFDPHYQSFPLEHFVPLIERLFARTPKACV
ncbi:MAG: HD domain-containing protein [Porticoccaceae bacterium]|jgi:predicted HD phosphohydrolase|nr:HD domain-containing protein [Porticoccaceae bacterium]MBT7374817.1 HD domain-containing protein [Porticoccaceae bacterium]